MEIHRTSFSKINWRKIAIIFLSIGLSMCFGCLKEPSYQDASFEYRQHMVRLRNKKNNFQLHTLIWRPGGFMNSSGCVVLAQGGGGTLIFSHIRWLGLFFFCSKF